MTSISFGRSRWHPAAVRLGEEWLVSGGRSAASSSEVYSEAAGGFAADVALPEPMAYHVTVGINSTHAFMVGGEGGNAAGRAWILDRSDAAAGQWTETARMAERRPNCR